MNSPMPVDELPSFIKKNQIMAQPVNNPRLKYIIVGGVLVLAVIISATLISKSQQKIIIIKPEENEN